MKREFAEMQNIVGLSGLLPREDDSLKGERNLEAMMNRQEKRRGGNGCCKSCGILLRQPL